jgi:UDP-N-acetyl-D-galactosamine dehydrogenase
MVTSLKNTALGIIGLGYVGLPLAIEFSRKRRVIGYDLSVDRVNSLRAGQDRTLEVSSEELRSAEFLTLTAEPEKLRDCNCFIITVPTPIDENKRPDLVPLERSSTLVGGLLKKGDVVIYESTVYPGCTEEFCVPILERESKLKFNNGFFCGYSPERINPGDKERTLTKIVKVTSGSTPEVANFVDALYNEIILAGTYKAENIKVAEAAKVIENTQRDLNIALINEIAIIFNKIGVDTGAVLNAAATKWNFIRFAPGLVGGHCIGVDPYYLTHKAQSIGYQPEVILAGRRLNDNMGAYVAAQLVKKMVERNIELKDSNVLIMGLTFKENCPDIRNTRVIDLVKELGEFGCKVDVYDPWAEVGDNLNYKSILLGDLPTPGTYDAIVIAVAHDQFKDLGGKVIREYLKPEGIVYDLKGAIASQYVDLRL